MVLVARRVDRLPLARDDPGRAGRGSWRHAQAPTPLDVMLSMLYGCVAIYMLAVSVPVIPPSLFCVTARTSRQGSRPCGESLYRLLYLHQ